MPIQDHLDVNTQLRALETEGNKFHAPCAAKQVNVQVMLCVQPIYRENLPVAQNLTARLRATPVYHYLTAKKKKR